MNAKNTIAIAKQVSLQFTQEKKSKKNGNSFVSITTNPMVINKDKTEQIIFGFVDTLYTSIQLRVARGEKTLDLGGVKFSFNQKFILSLIVDGITYSLNDIEQDVFNNVVSYSNFKKSGELANAILQVWNTANGNDALDGALPLAKLLNVQGKNLLIG
jgi:hypothetical protein